MAEVEAEVEDWDGWSDLEARDEGDGGVDDQNWATDQDYGQMFQPAPRWAEWSALGIDCITALVLAAMIIEQWIVWLLVTNLILKPWGMAIGILVALAQILAIFSIRTKSTTSCAIPTDVIDGDFGSGHRV